jgi:hypothetical protein
MKTKSLLLGLLTALAFTSSLPGADREHKKEAGPNGGRLLTSIEPHAEFFVTADRKVQITFVDDNGQPVAPGDQIVIVTTGERSAPTKLTFTKTGKALISDAALPAGNGLPTVVQIKSSPDAKTVTEKFNLDLSICPECKHGEYACVCDH